VSRARLELRVEDVAVRRALDALCGAVEASGGRALLVGGCVRDAALGITSPDLDVEVYGIEPQALIALLEAHFAIDLVGEAFGVIKLRDVPIDVSIPRSESKRGRGHRGFEVASDPQMDPRDAAARRDFTINAIALDPRDGRPIDPFRGLEDLAAGILRHTTEKFAEDPLRVLRGMQLVARFQLQPAPETLALCRRIEPEGLAPERLLEEWKKLILLGVRPSLGLAFLRACGWIRHFPELEALIGCEQDARWHPEGDVWTHTLHCMDAFAQGRIGDEREDLIVGFAVLCHDFGKPVTNEKQSDGSITSRAHDAVGVEPARHFLDRLARRAEWIDAVLPLVASHLAPVALFDAGAGPAAIRRLARRVGRIDRLVRVASADQRGRPFRHQDPFEAGEWLLERARELSIDRAPPAPIVMGRHLLELGLEPGPGFRPILDECFERQIDGEFDTLEGGVTCARSIVARGRQRPD
jgi:tRNA nucleotidyltransferase (CCA-adding enzyme)